MKPVSDPSILAALNGRAPISDPALLAQLNGMPRQPVGTMTDIAVEPTKALLSGTLASAAGGLAGLGTMATNAIGLTKADPADMVRSIQDRFTYQPRTKVGQNATQLLGYIPGKIAEGADWVGGKLTDLTGSPAVGAAANTALQALPMVAAPEMLKGKPQTGSWPARQIPAESAAAAKARALGMKLPPNPEQQPVGAAIASMTGRAQLERGLAMKNAPKVNEAINADLGIKGDRVDLAAMSRQRNKWNQAYRDASALPDGQFDADFKAAVSAIDDRTGNPTFGSTSDSPSKVATYKSEYSQLENFRAEDLVNEIKRLRANGFKNQSKLRNPEENAIGSAQLKLADALQGQLERHAQSIGQPEIASNLVRARTELAKLNTARRAVKGEDFSAARLNKLGEKDPITGNMRAVADAYESFDRALQDRSKIRNNGPFTVVDMLVGAGSLFTNPKLAAAVAARPFVRGLLGSELYQAPTFGPVRGPVNPSYAPNLLLGAQQPVAGLLGPQWQQQP